MLNAPRRHFLPWDRPLLAQAVQFLAGDWEGPQVLDLARTLVVVPTRQAGRRLREALAAYAARRGSAVFPPRVMTPEAVVALAKAPARASRLQLTLAWIELLQGIELAAFRDVFPIDPPERNFSWAQRLAEQLVRLQATLAENQLAIADVADRVAADFPETDRWRQLAALEQKLTARLAAAGLLPPGPRSAVAGAELGRDYDRVVLLATVDPLPSALAVLGRADVPVEVVVFAPEELAPNFDAWGRPLAKVWTERPNALPDFERRVHLCADPSDQAARTAALAQAYSAKSAAEAASAAVDSVLAVGVADPEVAALLEGEAFRAGVVVYNPEGEPRRNGGLYHLLTALGAVAATPDFAAVEALARCPDFLDYLRTRFGGSFSAARFLDALDGLRRRHLPPDLRTALGHARGELAEALAVMAEIHATLAQDTFPQNLAAVLGEIFRGRLLDGASEADAQIQDAAAQWTTVLRECAEAAALFPQVRPAEWRALALQAFGESRRTLEKPAGAIELQGWLELLFEDAPHLVVAGLNDGFVPEAVSEDPFLPESLRAQLGLKTNAARFARDAYLLQTLAASRTANGRLDLLFGKTSAAGDPLRPSRLLLRCADEDLPARVAFLFRPADSAESHLPWTRAWLLRPRDVPVPTTVAVTAVRRWLACPFRFYLKYALRMEAIEAGKTEMDAFDFGTLCHAALEAMGREPALRDCVDANTLREFLGAEFSRHAARQFGQALSLPLLVQVESARQRLAKFAEVQARDRADGWGIEAVEQPFAIEISGLVVKGKIDRIDRHERTGAIRVLDYKTSDAGVVPRAAHIRSLRSGEQLPEWATVMLDGKLRAWADLQLPLYRRALAPTFGPVISLAYVTLPKAVGETTLAVWEDYTPELHEAAMRCAEGVCAAVARGEFWPPNEDIRAESDEFAPLFHHGVAASVAWAKSTAEGAR